VWVWFTAAVLFGVAGFALLATDRAQRNARNRERRRWAALRGWQFAAVDHVLPARWQHGALAYYGTGVARDVVAGSTFTADGRRQVYVLDHETNGRVDSVLAGVRCRTTLRSVLELWLPSVQVPSESTLDLLGPVGTRYAFVSDISTARSMITPELVDAIEDVGRDVLVVWLEEDWVLAATAANASPARLERLLRDLGEVADLVDPLDPDQHDSPEHSDDDDIYRPSSHPSP
jgi:hypothetical protein